jgi:hypothetical protein
MWMMMWRALSVRPIQHSPRHRRSINSRNEGLNVDDDVAGIIFSQALVAGTGALFMMAGGTWEQML